VRNRPAAPSAAPIHRRRRRERRSAPVRRRRVRFGASRLTGGVPIISLRQVSKRYPGGFEALRLVSFTVEPGEMLFLTGHSGAGKTTLLKLIAAIERANGGTVVVNRPAILLADEPTASLDAAYADEIMEMFSAFNQVGVTVLVATHDQQLIGKWRKRVLMLYRGKLL